MNYARTPKPQLIVALRAAHSTIELQNAQLEARSATIIQQDRELVAAREEIALLRAQAQPLAEQINLITTRGQLMERLKTLAAQGVPCHMLGDAIRHRFTGAVLAQVTPR